MTLYHTYVKHSYIKIVLSLKRSLILENLEISFWNKWPGFTWKQFYIYKNNSKNSRVFPLTVWEKLKRSIIVYFRRLLCCFIKCITEYFRSISDTTFDNFIFRKGQRTNGVDSDLTLFLLPWPPTPSTLPSPNLFFPIQKFPSPFYLKTLKLLSNNQNLMLLKLLYLTLISKAMYLQIV